MIRKLLIAGLILIFCVSVYAANSIVTFQSAASKTASGNTAGVDCLNYKEMWICLLVSNVSGTTPTLDMKMQCSNDNASWVDLISFTQVTSEDTLYIYVPSDSTNHDGFGRYVRGNYTLGGSSPNFTFSLIATAKE